MEPNNNRNQAQIDHIIADTQPTSKKNKIYCDKWIHDGVCAFTQQGCKFKHEMPQDEATQRSLGLFHGLPSWWKRRFGNEMVKQGHNASIEGSLSNCVSMLELESGSARSATLTPSPRSPVAERKSASSGSQWMQSGIVPFYRGNFASSGRSLQDDKSWGSYQQGRRAGESVLPDGRHWRGSPSGL